MGHDVSDLEEAAILLEYYINEAIPSQETIGAHKLVDAIREADASKEKLFQVAKKLLGTHDGVGLSSLQSELEEVGLLRN